MSDIGLFGFGKTNEQSDIRSRNKNHSSYDESSNKKRELKKVRSAILKAIRIEGRSKIRPAQSRNIPIIAVVVRGGISQPLIKVSQHTLKMNMKREEHLL